MIDDLPPAFDPSFYREWADTNGVEYVDHEDGLLIFQRTVIKPERPVPGQPDCRYVREKLYEVFHLADFDIADGSGAFMIKRGLTRQPGFTRA